MNNPPATRPDWKRIATLALWLCLALPLGLWKLYHDETLHASTKWRILIYLCVIPTLAYITISIWVTSSSLQTIMP